MTVARETLLRRARSEIEMSSSRIRFRMRETISQNGTAIIPGYLVGLIGDLGNAPSRSDRQFNCCTREAEVERPRFHRQRETQQKTTNWMV